MAKTAIVTGAARGIGKAIARKLSNDGYNLVINYNNSKKDAEELRQELSQNNKNIILCRADVSSFEQSRQMINYTVEEFGTVDLLVNNAGIAQQILFNDMSEIDWDNMININLKSVFNCSRNVIDIMLKKHSGNIINISSMWGMVGASCEVHYSTAKAAIIGFSKALAKEVAPNGIRVNCVAPGVIQTDMLKDFTQDDLQALKDETPLLRLGNPEDIANTVSFLASDLSSFITGQVISPNGGFVI